MCLISAKICNEFTSRLDTIEADYFAILRSTTIVLKSCNCRDLTFPGNKIILTRSGRWLNNFKMYCYSSATGCSSSEILTRGR